jgi:hypothetical protein
MSKFNFGFLRFDQYWEEGILQVKFKAPKGTRGLILRADYSDAEGRFLSTQTTAHPFTSPSSKYISVISTKSELWIGEYALFQFTANFFIEKFNYVVSKMAAAVCVQWQSLKNLLLL